MLGAAFHVLDEARGAGRITGGPEHAWQGPQIDIADFRAPDLAGDLRGRDFTVNALAVGVGPLVAEGEADVEDPTGGRADLEARTVRLCAPRSLEDDPVRVLRGARFGAQPGWRLDPAFETAALRAAPVSLSGIRRAGEGRDPRHPRGPGVGRRASRSRPLGRARGSPARAIRDEGHRPVRASSLRRLGAQPAGRRGRRYPCPPRTGARALGRGARRTPWRAAG